MARREIKKAPKLPVPYGRTRTADILREIRGKEESARIIRSSDLAKENKVKFQAEYEQTFEEMEQLLNILKEKVAFWDTLKNFNIPISGIIKQLNYEVAKNTTVSWKIWHDGVQKICTALDCPEEFPDIKFAFDSQRAKKKKARR